METVFLHLLNMSITAGWLVLAVVVLRLLLRKAPRAITCALWGLVAVRLIFPVSIESVLSLIPSAETVPEDILYTELPTIDSGLPIVNNVVNPVLSETFAPAVGDSVNPMQVLAIAATWLWVAGMAALLVYTAVSYLRLHRRTREGVEWERGVWLCDRIDTPFILGVFRPRIFLPTTMGVEDKRYVLAHEKAHLRRGDHLWKPLGFALLTVYWFNPLLWVAYILLCRDIELACDEKVIRELGEESKAAYSDALINCSVPRRMVAACPLAFGEVGIKSRIRSVLHYKKPAFWVILVAVAASLAMAVCFLTNPVGSGKTVAPKNGLLIHSVAAECDDVSFAVINSRMTAEEQFIQAEWINKCEEPICFGEQFTLYKDDALYEPPEGYVWHLPLYLVNPNGGRYVDDYNLSAWDLPAGRYRLEKEFYKKSAPETKYRAYVVFSVGPTYGFLACWFDAATIVYDAVENPVYFREGSLPVIGIGDRRELVVDGQTVGELQSVTLKAANFDQRIPLGKWWDKTLTRESLRENNRYAFSLLDAENGRFYYLLEQADENMYLAVGDIRSYTVRQILHLNATTLRERYPELFDLSTDKGLEVYVFRMSGGEGGYRCILKSGKNLGYTLEELRLSDAVGITEMKKILAAYALPAKRISVHTFQHPLSSYLWSPTGEEVAEIERLLGLKGANTVVNSLERIVDLAEEQNLPTDDALELFFEDEQYRYFYPSIRSEYVIAYFSNGDEIPVKQALSTGRITMYDVEAWSIPYIKERKWNVQDVPNLSVVGIGNEVQKAWRGGYSWTVHHSDSGTGQTTVADAQSPQQATQQEGFPVWTYAADRQEDTPPVVKLSFDAPPHTVKVVCYRYQNGGWSEGKPLSLTRGSELALEYGDCLYEVTAVWKGNTGGNATYAFRLNTQLKQE